MAGCAHEGCQRTGRLTRGYCHTHYETLRRKGAITRVRISDPVTRVMSYVAKSDGCWYWSGSKSTSGYGRIYWNGAPRQAHRVIYEFTVGSIPMGMDLDHLCRDRTCVNPAHLEPVTRRENLLRGQTVAAAKASRDCCPNGHAFTEDNIYWWHNARYCRTCRAAVTRQRVRPAPQRVVIRAACVTCGSSFTFERMPGQSPNVCSEECRKDRQRKAAREFQRRKRAAAPLYLMPKDAATEKVPVIAETLKR